MISLPHRQEVLLTRQRHEADIAGLHSDYRMVIGDKAYSWATFKDIPGPGQSILLHEQPTHTSSYALSKKVIIPTGNYGAGTTTLDWVKRGRIINPDNSKDKFVLELLEGQRFLFKQVPMYSSKAWLFKNLTTKEEPVMNNKYLEKIAKSWFPKKEVKPNSTWKKKDFQERFTEMFDHGVKRKKLDADKVKQYKWSNTIGIANAKGQLSKLLVPNKKDKTKHLVLTHKDYKGK